MTPYLQIDGLTKSFGDLVLFENISFGIAEGQRIGLIAKNRAERPRCSISFRARRDTTAGTSFSVATCVWAIWSKTPAIPKS